MSMDYDESLQIECIDFASDIWLILNNKNTSNDEKFNQILNIKTEFSFGAELLDSWCESKSFDENGKIIKED